MTQAAYEPGPGGTAAEGQIQSQESWAGEARLNLVRLAALLLFYANHLLTVFLSHEDPVLTGPFHLSATALVMVWSIGVVVLWLYLARRWDPPYLKYVVTAWDTLLITTLLVLAGPRSPLIILYFLVIAAAPLRLSLGLVVAATLLALLGYGFLLAHHAYYVIGSERYYADPSLQVPRSHELIYALGLLAAGLLAGQVVRQAQRILPRTAPGPEPGASSRAAEVQQDTRLIAAGLVLMAVLVALGLLLAAFRGPQSLGAYSTLPVVAVISLLFVVAVAAALVEARGQDRPPSSSSIR